MYILHNTINLIMFSDFEIISVWFWEEKKEEYYIVSRLFLLLKIIDDGMNFFFFNLRKCIGEPLVVVVDDEFAHFYLIFIYLNK